MARPLSDRSNIAGPRRSRDEVETLQSGEPSARRQPQGSCTPSPPLCSRKHSPWTNPRERKNRRMREWEHEETVEERGEDEAGVNVKAADCQMQVLQQFQSVRITSSPEECRPKNQIGLTRASSDPSRPLPDSQDISPPKKVKLDESPIFEDRTAGSPARSDLNLESVMEDHNRGGAISGSESSIPCPKQPAEVLNLNPNKAIQQMQSSVSPRALQLACHLPEQSVQGPQAVGGDSAATSNLATDGDYLFLRRRDLETDDSSCWSGPTHSTSESLTSTDGHTESPRATSPLRITQYTQKLNLAARHCDLMEAEALWQELGRSGLDPDVHTLNALLRCFLSGGVAFSVATAVVEDMCRSTNVQPNNFTEQLLASLMLQTEQLQAEW